MDPRIEWLTKKVKWGLKSIDAFKMRDCFERAEDSLLTFCETDGNHENRCPVCLFYIEGSDRHEDGYEDAKKGAKLCLAVDYLPPELVLSESVLCMYFMKSTSDPITRSQMEGQIDVPGNQMERGVEYGVMDCPRLQTVKDLMLAVYLPAIDTSGNRISNTVSLDSMEPIAIPTDLSFDKEWHSPLVELSDDGTKANLVKDVSEGITPWAVGDIPFTRGRYEWSVRFEKGTCSDVAVAHRELRKEKPSSYGKNRNHVWAYSADGSLKGRAQSSTKGAPFAEGDTITVDVDLDLGTLEFFKNGKPQLKVEGVYGEVHPCVAFVENGSICEITGFRMIASTDANESEKLTQLQVQLQDDVKTSVLRLCQNISTVIHQVSGDRKLNIPSHVHIGDSEQEIKLAQDNEDLLSEIDEHVLKWNAHISVVIEAQQQNDSASGKSPLSEIDFWKDKYAVLSAIYEQLNLPHVRTMLKILKESDVGTSYPNFEISYNNLSKMYHEAKDNVKFLSTLERHFRAVTNVTPGQSLQPIIDTLPSMMTAIRMVWTISRYYNTDEKMMRLLEKIANTIAEKVSRHVNVKSVPGQPSILSCGRDGQGFEDAKRKIIEGEAVLEQWKKSYQKTRCDIEMTERDARWEFDKKRLFHTTDYMTARCEDLLDIVTTLEYYYTVLGSQLKAVTKDTVGIDQVMKKVEDLKKPIETVAFDIFDDRANPNWTAQFDRFKRQVEQMNAHTRQFIESSFKQLRSSEAAFELLQSFKTLPPRAGTGGDYYLGNLLIKKSEGILDRYKDEVKEVEQIFKENHLDPPLTKNQPPVAGAIDWSESLFQRIKGPIKKFLEAEDSILQTAKGKDVRKTYVSVAKLMKEYAVDLYDKWKYDVNTHTIDYLKANILTKHVDNGETHYSVNFDNNLFQIIQEAKYLDRLGYDVPGIALRVTLLDEKYHDFVENLKLMLAKYHETLAAVESPERAILGEHIAQLEVAIEPGWKTLNWNSLGVKEYINKALAAIGEFNAKSKEIHKNSAHISQVVSQISTTWLVDPQKLSSPGTEGLLDLNDLAESLESYRNKQVQKLTKQYARISPLLRKIEGIVTNTNTGKAPALRSYYYHWERRIYKALNKMVMISLSLFLSFLNINPSKRHRASQRKSIPLFKVTASLVAGEIGVSPEMKEILHTLTAKIMNNIIEATKHFVRWMDGTCIECSLGEIHPKPADDTEHQPFTYYNDISKGTQVISFKTKVNQGIQRTFFHVHKHLQSWRKYKDLWHVPKEKFIERLGAKNLPWLEYDARFADFTRLIKGLDQYPQEKNIDFLCLDCNPLLAEIQKEARTWIQMEGKQLNEQFRAKLEKLNARINKCEDELNIKPDLIDDLKRVLSTIDNMNTCSMDIELQYREIENCYSTLQQYGIEIPPEEWNMAMSLRVHWERLKLQAKKKDEDLGVTKATFRQVTVTSVEKFTDELAHARDDFLNHGPGRPGIDLDKGLELINEWKIDLLQKQKKREGLVKSEKLFGLDITFYPALQEMEEKLFQLNQVFEMYAEWKELVTGWSNTQWADVHIDTMRKGTEGMMQKLKKKYKEFGDLPPYSAMKEVITNFFSSLPLFTQLKNEALRDRHWKKLMDVTGRTFDFSNFTLASLIEMRPFEFEDDINEIVACASRELNIENSLKAIKETWMNTSFDLIQKKRTKLLADTREIQETIDEHTMNLQSIANFKWVKPFLDEVRLWERKLNTMTDVVSEWAVVQQKWIYLESIFVGGEDIAAQLPKEAKKFDDLDKRWITIMKQCSENSLVDAACHSPDRLADLKWISDKLDECQKGLTDYLNTKRMAFPRFYFISDDDLLSILSSSNPRSVQEHMLKMFDNCAVLYFKQGSDAVEGTQSQEREPLVFDNTVNTEGFAVEKWLSAVLIEVRRTLRGLLKGSVFFYPKKPRLQWIDESKGMCGLAGSQIWWTFQVEDAFLKVRKGKKNAVKDLVIRLSSQLDEMVVEMDNSSLPSLQRKKINTLIIVDVHGRDIVDRFVRDAILDARDFAWESQLRFYWKKDIDNCVIHQCTAVLNYGYEFMGLNGRLVITPLTDRCFMTLTQALSYHLGGAPGGPAGTGKTESVKDLAKSLSYYCVVFNCGEGLDYKAMASIFCGLAQCGAWGCFDEFNRIELPVLSVVSEQLRAMQDALKCGATRCEIQGAPEEITLDPNVGVFITMNPGYAGRVELPDNLKALFRPVVMVVPNLELIAEIMLYAEGFKQARMLAKKMVTLYKLAKGQLSKQYHYDWGLRALKAVLVMAGALKRRDAELPEDVVLMRALRDMNAPKFVFEDVPLFSGLIGDLFPGLDPTRVPNEKLAKAVRECLTTNRDMIVPSQIDKVVQLYETMQTRHTTMTVGPTSGGKTTVIQYLKLAQDALRLPTKLFTLNAKAQHISCLYGVLDPMTRTWTDGIFSHIFRQINRDSEKEKEQGNESTRRYVVFDGDVDALWVENMNTVMDDNKLLTLANGDRIRLNNPMCSLLFEVGDLQYASPATVSRVGMVYVDPQNLQWQPYMHKWVLTRSKEEQDSLKELIDKYIPTLRNFVLDGIDVDGNVVQSPKLSLPLTDCNMVKQLCLLLTCMLQDHQLEQRSLEGVFIFCCVWSFGSVIVENDRPRFDQVIKSKSGQNLQPSDDLKPVSAGQLPEKKTLFEFCFNTEVSKWVPWKDPSMIPEYIPPTDGKYSSILVPTVDTVRNSFFLDLVIDKQTPDPKTGAKMPIMFIGASGTAKTVTIQKFLRELKLREKGGDKDEMKLDEMILEMNFSSRTMSVDVQRTLEDNVEKRTATIFGAPPGKKLIIFIDDINMPVVDTYGTMQPIAFLKLLTEWNGWYDRKDLLWKSIRDIEYVAAMAPPGGGRNALDPRFISLYACFHIPFPAAESLESIYTEILKSHLSSFDGPNSAALLSNVPRVCQLTMSVYSLLCEKLPPTPAKFHYLFNLRDLSRVYEGMCRMTQDAFDTPAQMIRLWRNEVLRVFHDRMPDLEDKMVVVSKIKKLISEHYAADEDYILKDPILFGDFSDFDADDRLCLYDDMGNYQTVRELAELILDEYNTPSMKMSLVMFDMALDHLVRIVRILTLPRGNALLVGVGGSGKQSLTHLGTHAAGISQVFEITITRGYNEDSFRENLKDLYRIAGVENDGSKVVFLFTDSHVVQEGFLEAVNNMLASGMVPALFADDEKDACYNAVAAECEALGLIPTKDNKWNTFVSRCRDNLHIVLSMSPSGDKLRTRCRNFPALVNNTVIDWFSKWPDQALNAVSFRYLEDYEKRKIAENEKAAMKEMGDKKPDTGDDTLSPVLKELVVEHMVYTHLTCDIQCGIYKDTMKRLHYVTPKNFLDYISNYTSLLDENRTRIDELRRKLRTGLDRLKDAAETVVDMQIKMSEQQVHLDEMKRANDELVLDLSKKQADAEDKSEKATGREKEVAETKTNVMQNMKEAEEVLEEAMPAVMAAEKELDKIQKKDMDELRTFAKPSEKIVAVAEMYCVIQGKTASWANCKADLQNPNFVTEKLKKFPKDSLTEKRVTAVNAIRARNKDLNDKSIEAASIAAAGLYGWVMSLVSFYSVAKKVEPKKLLVQRLEKNLAQLEKELEYLRAEVRALNDMKEMLTERLDRGQAEAKRLEADAQVMQKRLNNAKRLIGGLASERQRWHDDFERLGKSRKKLIGDCLLGASFLSYLGAFTFNFREEILGTLRSDVQEREIEMNEDFSLQKLLTTDVLISKWNADGLPSDELSIQNGILATRASTFPLCVDPQKQAVGWIKRMFEKSPKFEVATFAEPSFPKRLEAAVQYGNPFLFENVDEFIDPILDPVLEKKFVYQSGQKLIKVGDKLVEYDNSFRLFMTTKLSNPNYTPEIFGKSMVINFGVTLDGLRDQLLNEVVLSERNDLARHSEELIHSMAENKQTLQQLEDTLIRELSLAQGEIIDNDDLISTLEETKCSAEDIAQKLESALATKKDIDRARQDYLPVAKRGAILFFCIAGISAINSMYEYSLAAFLHDVFKVSLERSEGHFEPEQRLENIIVYLTRCLYQYVCMGIFQVHVRLFAFLMTARILGGHDAMNPNELDFFLKGCVLPDKNFPPKPSLSWITELAWNDLCRLSLTSDAFANLPTVLTNNADTWHDWFCLQAPEGEKVILPGGYDTSLNPFQKLCLLRCFRVDRVYLAVGNFISVTPELGPTYAIPYKPDLRDVFAQSSATSPIVCITTPGANPTEEIDKLAQRMEMKDSRLKALSLGQGQGSIAMNLVEQGSVRGHWVLLQNCHLLIDWMKEIEKTLEKRDAKPHPEFRLWLTTEPSEGFPLGILQRSLKVVFEPPDGLKMNMTMNFVKVTEEVLEECPHPAFKPLVFTLAFFHAVVQERRKYGKLGWNVIYDFNETDFTISMLLMCTYLTKAWEDQSGIPWETLRYLVGEAMYGGRVSDDWDRRVVLVYLQEYFGDFLFDTFQPFHFYMDSECDYSLPVGSTDFSQELPREAYVNQIREMRNDNSPEVFGLHPNAEIGYLTTMTRSLWGNLLQVQAVSGSSATASSGGGESKDDQLKKLSEEITSQVPAPIDRKLVMMQQKKKAESDGFLSPAQVVLLQEIERWNTLVTTMVDSLKELLKALAGVIGMSADLDELASALLSGALPPSWRRKAPDTRKGLGSWIIHFKSRHAQYSEWIDNGEPTVIWLSGIMIPDSYIAALVQTTCRKYKWPLDKSSIFTRVTDFKTAKDVKTRLEDGAYVRGLYLEGASWDSDKHQLGVQAAKQLIVDLPILAIIPKETAKIKRAGTFLTPVYVTQGRKSAAGVGHVFDADLSTSEHLSHWVLNSVACCLNSDT